MSDSEQVEGGEDTDKEPDAASDTAPPRPRPYVHLACVHCKEKCATFAVSFVIIKNVIWAISNYVRDYNRVPGAGVREAPGIQQAPRRHERGGAAPQGAAAAHARGAARRAAGAGDGGGRRAGGADHLLPRVPPQPPHHAPRTQPHRYAPRHEALPHALLSDLQTYFPFTDDI